MATAQGHDPICKICTNEYSSDRLRKPRSLPCGHSLCTDCLGQHIDNTVIGITFLCPFDRKPMHVENSGQRDGVTLAEQFPVNYELTDTIEGYTRDQLRKDWNSLKLMCDSVEHKLIEKNNLLLQGLDLSVSQTSADLDSAADKLIDTFKTLVREDHDTKRSELGVLHETARKDIEENFNENKTVLNTPRTFLNSSENLLSDNTLSESSIKDMKTQIKELKKPLTDYLATPSQRGQENKIVFKKSVNVTGNISVGSIKLTDERTMTKSVVGNPASDNMELVKVIKTDIDSLYDIDVLVVLRSLKIIVSSNSKSYIQCYNYEDGTQHCMYKTSSGPRGLVTLRDGRVVVVVEDRKILFLTVNEDITVMKSVKTKKQYNMITQLTNSNLAVSVYRSDPGCVDILNLNCDVIQSIPNLSHSPFYLTALRSGVVVVCRGDQSVSCVISDHDWVARRNISRLESAWGITCDISGFTYVADFLRHLIVQLGPSGVYLRDVITRQNGLSGPTAVCFHGENLYITQYNGEIKIFTWK